LKRAGTTIEDLGEFGFISSIAEGCLNKPEGVVQGIGDDCAVIGPFGEKVLLVTTDLLVEKVHFILNRISPEHLGEKSIAVNLSDIAAMGGNPLHVLVSIAIPPSFPVPVLDALYDGMKSICREYSVNILGGDTSSSPAGLFINIMAVGEAHSDRVLYRRGASPGDRIYVCGTVGDSAAGLKILKGEIPVDEEDWARLIEAHTRPRPRVREGRLIGESGLASAMIDVSDGLVADLGHICDQSGVGAEIEESRLPISEELTSFSRRYDLDPVEMALTGGEDYCLLVTVPQKDCERFEELLNKNGVRGVFEVGRIVAGTAVQCIRTDGKKRELSRTGFDHF